MELLLGRVGDGFLHWLIIPPSAPLKGDPMPKIFAFSMLLLLYTGGPTSYAGQTVSRETVRLVSSHQSGHEMRIVMQSQTASYIFACTYKAAGCIIPIPNQPYYLITESNPLGKYDLGWLKNWYVDYHDAPNIGIVPTSGWPDEKDFMKTYNEVGSYWLVSLTVRK